MQRVLTGIIGALAIGTSAPSFAQTAGGMSSSSKLTQDPGRSDSWTYRHPSTSPNQFKQFMILPTVVYENPTAGWGSTTPIQRQKFAAYLTDALRREVGKGYQIVDQPGPGVGAMQLTLLGVQGTTPLAATASRMTPFGFALNGMKSLVGKPGSLTGSVQAGFELKDSRTGEVVFAAIRRRSPDALDIESTLSTEKTVQAVADDMASAIRKGLDRLNGR